MNRTTFGSPPLSSAAIISALGYTPANEAHTGTDGMFLLSTATVNLNDGTAAKQPLYTCPAARNVIPTNVVLHHFSGNPTTFAASIGWDAGADNVVVNLTASAFIGSPTIADHTAAWLTSIPDTADGITVLSWTPTMGTPADVLGLIVQTPEGSALTCKVDVFGYLTSTVGVPSANIIIP